MRIAIIGGLGHVGLPLGLALAEAGHDVVSVDISGAAFSSVVCGVVPFIEHGSEELLSRNLGHRFRPLAPEAPCGPALESSEAIIITLGTPLDEFQNPRLDAVLGWFREYGHALKGQLVVLRSTVYPGTTAAIRRYLAAQEIDVDLAFCPERILQGEAIRELKTLPQIVAGVTERAYERAAELFSTLGVEIVRCSPEEAELAKLFLNNWRYQRFAVANSFYAICQDLGVKYQNVERAMRQGYARADGLPSPGFAAGPCLLKDTMQLAAAAPNGFPLGHAARLVNEGLPDIIMRKIRSLGGLLDHSTVGILGMAFKADNDDIRDSLSFKLKKQLEFAGAHVLCSDEYVQREGWVTKEELVARSTIVVCCVPHRAYNGLHFGGHQIDTWGVLKGGIRA